MNTKVIFRKFKDTNEVIALFPEEVANENGDCISYMRVGQHGAATYSHVMKQTVEATPEERQALYNELVGLGYSLEIRYRWHQGRVKNSPAVQEFPEANLPRHDF